MRSDMDQAIALLKQGNPGAIERALALLQNAVFSFGMRVCGQREDAEDTMQEVLIKAIPYLPKFDHPGALAKWLYKVAKNHCLMSRRRSKFAPQRDLSLEELMPSRKEMEQLQEKSGSNPEDSAMSGEQGRRLREAIRSLPPHYRIVLVLRDMEGFSDEEVGEILGYVQALYGCACIARAYLCAGNSLEEKPKPIRQHERRHPILRGTAVVARCLPAFPITLTASWTISPARKSKRTWMDASRARNSSAAWSRQFKLAGSRPQTVPIAIRRLL